MENLPIKFTNKKIGLLIGLNRPRAIVHTTLHGPYATEHMFGWAVSGNITNTCFSKMTCLRIKTDETNSILNDQFQKCFARDFIDDGHVNFCSSVDDISWLKKVEDSVNILPNGQFQISLPLRDDIVLPLNYDQAYRRLINLKNKFVRNSEYFNEYSAFMDDMLNKDYAELIPTDKIKPQLSRVWYLTHFSVRHKQKNKLRIVFDCSLKYNGKSLNDFLLQGPDLTNSLLGVLLRFREGLYAFSADIQNMFYRVRVPECDSDLMRFLWYPNNDLSKKPCEYRLKVHVFGAKSSPSCANYALRATSNDVSDECVRTCINSNFYVDDVLKSSNDESELIHIAFGVINTLFDHGFNLTNFTSSSRSLLNSLPKDKLSKGLKELDICNDVLPSDKALGVTWNVQDDSFSFRVDVSKAANDPNLTKRKILSTLFKIYDPLFVISPIIVTGKRIFQEACELTKSWDHEVPESLKTRWHDWLSDLKHLEKLRIPRCFTIASPVNRQLHVFCDGSMTAYGAVAYIRTLNKTYINCSVIMAKARLTPLNRSSLKTVPRIELNPAKLAVQLQQQIANEVSTPFD